MRQYGNSEVIHFTTLNDKEDNRENVSIQNVGKLTFLMLISGILRS